MGFPSPGREPSEEPAPAAGRASKQRNVRMLELRHRPELSAALRNTEGVTVRETEDVEAEFSMAGYVSEEFVYEIVENLPEAERSGFADAAAQHRRDTRKLMTPAGRGEPFVAPRLMAQILEELEFADSGLFTEHHGWLGVAWMTSSIPWFSGFLGRHIVVG